VPARRPVKLPGGRNKPRCNPGGGGILDSHAPYEIWDIAAEEIKTVNGHEVKKPDFKTPAAPDSVMIVTIGNPEIYETVKAQFEPLGYKVCHGLPQIMKEEVNSI
jgi:hypothetical protein